MRNFPVWWRLGGRWNSGGSSFGGGRYLAECFVPMVVGSPRDLVRMGKKYTGKKGYIWIFWILEAIERDY